MKTSVKQTTPNVSAKVVLLGESLVGKTSFATVVTTGVFDPNILSTVGASFRSKLINVDNKYVNLNIWDTAGQEHYRSLAPMFYRDADFVLLVYSIDNKKSFKEIKHWYKNLQYDCLRMPIVYIIANKLDLESIREVPTEDGLELANKLNASFYEISTRTQIERVGEIIQNIALRAITVFGTIPNEVAKVNLTKTNNSKTEDSSCC